LGIHVQKYRHLEINVNTFTHVEYYIRKLGNHKNQIITL
jgi:hypothetical protein